MSEMCDIAERTAEGERLNEGLERRVADRTLELAAANQEMEREVAEHKQVEEQLLHSHSPTR